MASSNEDLQKQASRDLPSPSSSGDLARPGTEAHSQQRQGQYLPRPEQQAEYDDRYAQQGGQPHGSQQGQGGNSQQDQAGRGPSGLLGERDLQPMPHAGTSGASGEYARKPDSERNR